MMNIRSTINQGFTIIEMMVVIVMIGILAGLVTMGYANWQDTVAKKAVQSDLQMVASAMENAKNFGNGYPTSIPSNFSSSSDVEVTYYTGSPTTYCIDGLYKSRPNIHYFIYSTQAKTPVFGTCATGKDDGGGGILAAMTMQTITTATCPTTRALGVDARDNHTYWVQKLADGKCWMLTNLAYAGGGNNTYNDTKTITEACSETNTTACYYVPSGANPTTSPTLPSTSTDGSGQYGYFYNQCAAMGGQLGTAACSDAATPASNPNISICPSGWRLPTGGSGSELQSLNAAINSGSTTTDAGLRTAWLAQRGGLWRNGFLSQGSAGWYRSSTQYISPNVTDYSYSLLFQNSSSDPASTGLKRIGEAVRCVAM